MLLFITGFLAGVVCALAGVLLYLPEAPDQALR
jgi:hypothetical protein